jgi:hypothetical protein
LKQVLAGINDSIGAVDLDGDGHGWIFVQLDDARLTTYIVDRSYNYYSRQAWRLTGPPSLGDSI